MIRVGVLGSTRGTSMNALASAVQINIVISNKADALILERARELGLMTACVDPTGISREQFDQRLSDILRQHDVNLVVLIGYMRILSDAFVQAWEKHIINVHPSLLPAFAGKMDKEVHKAVLASGVKETGCTVHYVTPQLDAGPIILQKKCPVLPDDTIDSLKQRVQDLEGLALVEAVEVIAKHNAQ